MVMLKWRNFSLFSVLYVRTMRSRSYRRACYRWQYRILPPRSHQYVWRRLALEGWRQGVRPQIKTISNDDRLLVTFLGCFIPVVRCSTTNMTNLSERLCCRLLYRFADG